MLHEHCLSPDFGETASGSGSRATSLEEFVAALRAHPFRYGYEASLEDERSVIILDPSANAMVGIAPLPTRSSLVWHGHCVADAVLTLSALRERAHELLPRFETLEYIFTESNSRLPHHRIVTTQGAIEHGAFFADLDPKRIAARHIIEGTELNNLIFPTTIEFSSDRYLKEGAVGSEKITIAASLTPEHELSFTVLRQQDGLVTTRHEVSFVLPQEIFGFRSISLKDMADSLAAVQTLTTHRGLSNIVPFAALEDTIQLELSKSALTIIAALKRGLDVERARTAFHDNLELMRRNPTGWWHL